MEIFIVCLLVATGILLLVLEFLVIPGVAVAGTAGVAFMAGGVYYAYTAMSNTAGNWTLILSAFALILMLVWVLRSKTWNKAALETEIKGQVLEHETEGIAIGDQGQCISRLAPMGKIRINGKIIEAKSIAGYVDTGSSIEVVKIDRTNVIVKLINI